MVPHLMRRRAIIEFVVIDNKRFSAVRIHNGGVMSLSRISVRREVPLIKAHQTHPCGARSIACLAVHYRSCIFSQGIQIRPLDILGSEQSHIITAFWVIAAIGQEEEIVIPDLLDVGALPADCGASCDLISGVGIGNHSIRIHLISGVLIGSAIVPETSLRIQLDHGDTA